jgi:hypothetical protein
VFDDQRRTKTTENHPWTCWLIHSLALWVSGLTRVSVPCGRIQMSVLQAGRFIRFDNGKLRLSLAFSLRKLASRCIDAHGPLAVFRNMFRNFVLRSPEKNDERERVKCVAVFLVVSFACLSHIFALYGPCFRSSQSRHCKSES